MNFFDKFKPQKISISVLKMEANDTKLFIFKGYEMNPAGLSKQDDKSFAVLEELDMDLMQELDESTPQNEWPTLGRYCTIHYGVMTPLKTAKVKEGEIIQLNYEGEISRPTEQNPEGVFHVYHVDVLREEKKKTDKPK